MASRGRFETEKRHSTAVQPFLVSQICAADFLQHQVSQKIADFTDDYFQQSGFGFFSTAQLCCAVYKGLCPYTIAQHFAVLPVCKGLCPLLY